jgi:hypothetical protein
VKDLKYIDVKTALVFRLGNINWGFVFGNWACIVDEDVQLSELFEHCCNGRVPVFALGNVHLLNYDEASWEFRSEITGASGVDVANKDFGALFYEKLRDGCSEARPST